MMTGSRLTEFWTENMTKRRWIFGAFPPQTIKDAWFSAGKKYYDTLKAENKIPNTLTTVIFRVTGWDNCMDDKLTSYPDIGTGSLTVKDQQVYP